MPRATNAVARKKRKKKTLVQAKGYYGRKHSSYRFANEQVMRSGNYAFRDRRVRKREFRKLWILRINAACRERGLRYSEFIHGLTKAGIELDRKMLSEIAISDPAAFDVIVAQAKAAIA
jgi:large subunit ribosomal protein L20